MTVFLESLLCFSVEMISFLLCFLCVRKLKLKNRYSLLLFVIIAIIAQLVWQIGLQKTSNIAFEIGFLFPFFCKDKNIKNTYIFHLIVALMESLSYGMSVYLVAIFDGHEVDAINGSGFNLLCLLLFPVVVIVYYLLERFLFLGKMELLFLKEQKITLFIALISGIFCLVMHVLMAVRNSNTKERLLVSGISFVCIIIIYMLTIVWQGRAMWKNQQLLQKQSMYDYLTKSQQQYLDFVIKRDDDLRKFKHDIRAHMIIMKSLAQKNDSEGILAYIDEVNDMTHKSDTQHFTGNSTVDAIINDLKVRMDQENITLSVNGQMQLTNEDKVFDISLCLYNILLNAIEALEKLEVEYRLIQMEIKQYQKKIYFKISNKCSIMEDIEGITELITTKDDSQNHGIGSRNIADIVRKNEGKIIYSVKDSWFITELLI